MSQPKPYSWRILLWLDQGLNVWGSPIFNRIYKTDKFGDEDEVISSVLGKMQKAGRDTRFRKVVDFAFLKITGQKDHCLNNIEDDECIHDEGR